MSGRTCGHELAKQIHGVGFVASLWLALCSMGTFQSYRLDPGHESLPDKLLPPQWTPLQKRGSAQAHDSQTTVQTYIETSSRRRSMATQHLGRSPSWQWTRLHCAETGPPWHGTRISRTGFARTMQERPTVVLGTVHGRTQDQHDLEPPVDRREDGQPAFGGRCVISRQPAFSVPS